MRRTLCSLFVATSLLGCASPPDPKLENSATPQQILASESDTHKATVNLPEASGPVLFKSNTEISANGVPIASLPRLTHKKLYLKPGSYEIEAMVTRASFAFLDGQTYYIVVAYSPGRSWLRGLAGDPVSIKQVAEEEARTLMKEMKPQ